MTIALDQKKLVGAGTIVLLVSHALLLATGAILLNCVCSRIAEIFDGFDMELPITATWICAASKHLWIAPLVAFMVFCLDLAIVRSLWIRCAKSTVHVWLYTWCIILTALELYILLLVLSSPDFG